MAVLHLALVAVLRISDVMMRRQQQAGSLPLQPLPDRGYLFRTGCFARLEVIQAEHQQRIRVIEDAFIDGLREPRLVDPLVYGDRMAGHFLCRALKVQRGAMEQFQRAGDTLQEALIGELRFLESRPGYAPDLGHRREAVVQHGQVALRFPWIAPGPVDAQASAAGRAFSQAVALVVGPGGLCSGCHCGILVHCPRLPSQCSARMPGRKKYAPPRTVVKLGRPVIFLFTGRFGILKSSVPSCAPMNGSRSFSSSWKLRSLTQTFCANSYWRMRLAQMTKAAMPRSLPSSAVPSGRCGPYVAPRRIMLRRFMLWAVSRGFMRRMCDPSGTA